MILVLEDARYVAGYGSSDDYCFFSVGGASWLPPWLVGLYALCLQVDPDLDPETFLNIRMIQDIRMEACRKSQIRKN
ncbi:hypothetical protein [Dubosiella newyorkensis]|uniref:Uncharacterized protein n=1 Tax=Dubosiella newyorkensis TaxID=1862672 RepID=A0A1U7NJP7_9FIRM|nr:hypothetical protein [Dubosiella newyorkensis]OLU43749.1 hypothetical protein BO225_11610 [Dubosiella newyorkensis]